MSKRKWTDERLIEAVKTSLSYAEVMNLKQLAVTMILLRKRLKNII